MLLIWPLKDLRCRWSFKVFSLLIWPSQPHRQDVQHAAMHTDLSVVALQRAVLRPAAVLIHGTSPALVVHGAHGTSAVNFVYVVRTAEASATCLRPRRLSHARAANFMHVVVTEVRVAFAAVARVLLHRTWRDCDVNVLARWPCMYVVAIEALARRPCRAVARHLICTC